LSSLAHDARAMIFGALDADYAGTPRTGGLGSSLRQAPSFLAAEVGKISTPMGVLQLGTSSSSTPPSPRRLNQLQSSLSPRSHLSSQPGTLAPVHCASFSRSPPRSPTQRSQLAQPPEPETQEPSLFLGDLGYLRGEVRGMQMKLDQVSRSVGDLVALHRESGNRDMTSSTVSSSLHKEMTDAIHSAKFITLRKTLPMRRLGE